MSNGPDIQIAARLAADLTYWWHFSPVTCELSSTPDERDAWQMNCMVSLLGKLRAGETEETLRSRYASVLEQPKRQAS